MDESLIITARQVRAAGACILPGAKAFFKRHNLDFKSFIRNGIPAEQLLATEDEMAVRVVELVKSGAIKESDDGQE